LEQWIRFFLSGVIDIANDSIETFKKIINLRQKYEDEIIVLGRRAKKAKKLLNYLYSKPITNNKEITEKLNISFNTANRLIQSLMDLNLLNEITGFSRNRLFVLKEYLDLFNK
jgi:Fic family protein